MSLSPSQARLIALTARMSDVEYEGQQVNQQRGALANRTADVYNQLEKMEVPTPPSPYDFKKTVYSGATGSGDKVYVVPKDDGSFSLTVPTMQDGLATKNNAITADTRMDPEEAKDVPNASNSIIATFKKEVEVQCYRNKTTNQQISTEEYGTLKAAAEQAQENLDEAFPKGEPRKENFEKGGTFNKDEYDTAHNKWKDLDDANTTAQNKVQEYKTDVYYEISSDITDTVTSSNGGAVDSMYAHNHGLNGHDGKQPIKYTFTDAFDVEQTDKSATDLQNASSGYSHGQIQTMLNHEPVYYTDETCSKKLTENDFDKATGKLKTGIKLYTRTKEQPTVGGSATYSVEDAKSKFANDPNKSEAFSKVMTALDNHLRDQLGNIDYNGWYIAESGNNFRVFQKVGENQFQEYDMAEEKTWKQSSVSPTLSANGVPTAIKDPATGQTISMLAEKVDDEDAYQAAMNVYTKEKAEYDQEQDRLNAETKKLQAIDKQLELKLKRLDTERNMLNTEIDAVKKVIQDSVEKGFKTFSG